MVKYRKSRAEYLVAAIMLMYTFFTENIMLDGDVNYVVWGGGKNSIVLFLCFFYKRNEKGIDT